MAVRGCKIHTCHQKSTTEYIPDWKTNEPQNMSRNIHDLKKKIAQGNNMLHSGSSLKGQI